VDLIIWSKKHSRNRSFLFEFLNEIVLHRHAQPRSVPPLLQKVGHWVGIKLLMLFRIMRKKRRKRYKIWVSCSCGNLLSRRDLSISRFVIKRFVLIKLMTKARTCLRLEVFVVNPDLLSILSSCLWAVSTKNIWRSRMPFWPLLSWIYPFRGQLSYLEYIIFKFIFLFYSMK